LLWQPYNAFAVLGLEVAFVNLFINDWRTAALTDVATAKALSIPADQADLVGH
jgi:hypothetical protein